MKNIEMLRRTVSLDLDLEHVNNHTKNALCNLGPILTKDVVTRIARAQKGKEEIVGPHTTVSEQKDFMAIEETQQRCVQQGHVCADRKWCKLGRFSDLPKNNC